MTRLSGEGEQLVRAGRAALKPSDADRERVLQALQRQLGGNLAAEEMSRASTAPAAASGTIAKVTAALVAISVAGAGMFFALRDKTPPATPAAVAPVTTATVPEAPVDLVPESARVGETQAQSSDEKRSPAPPRTADSLAEEVAMLSQASGELHAGRPLAALTALDEHRRKFPHGVLTEERTSARIQALCALGRTNEAQAELARLARMSPKSPHLARARKACGSGTTQKD